MLGHQIYFSFMKVFQYLLSSVFTVLLCTRVPFCYYFAVFLRRATCLYPFCTLMLVVEMYITPGQHEDLQNFCMGGVLIISIAVSVLDTLFRHL